MIGAMHMKKIFIVAEAGVNHNGDLDIAKRMIDAASDANADAIKFQTFQSENLVCIDAPKASYQNKTTDTNETQYEMLKKLELSPQMHRELITYCHKKNILFLSTPFDVKSIDFLCSLDIPIIKVPSGEITNLPYLRAAAKTKKDIFLSTGMSSLTEVKEAIYILHENGAKDITVLHCNTQYPTPVEDVNLNAMVTMKEMLNVPVGFSDHTDGIEIPIAAAAMGATVIEKHFTLNRKMKGPDHKASIEPQELIKMVSAIRNVEKAMGSKEKKRTPSEQENIAIVRKSIVAACTIRKGDIFSENNLTVKRPGTGISPMKWDNIMGMKAKKNFDKDEMISI